MISIKHINKNYIDSCYELDSKTISLWSKKQWANEFRKDDIRVYGLLFSHALVGLCVFHVIIDQAEINFFAVDQNYRKKGFGSYLMSYLIKQCEKLNVNKLFLEVSQNNVNADRFYSRFDFTTVGIRKNYYKDGSDALLKEKNLTTK